ncbi:MAG: molecular chaperone DnaJ [Candidatus Doudnabacteria bacterium]|nr:molecular chaperone DnaJ [Candidatus Doudnabacteria bacterium]
MAKDFYEVLGVDRSASQDEIKKAFRKKAHELHPDKDTGDEAAFKEVNEAYQTLSDEQKRAQYDQFGQAFSGGGGPGGPGGFGGFQGGFPGGAQGFPGAENIDLNDIFSSMFGGQARGGRRARRQGGEDISVRIDISFEESFSGVERTLEIEKRVKCEKCSGNGAEPGTPIETCGTCEGRGQVEQQRQTMFGVVSQVVICPTCAGEGKTAKTPCEKCSGDGRTRERVQVKVFVPAGISDGQTIEIQGGGEAGKNGTPAGNLFVTVGVIPHPDLQRDGNDVLMRLPVSFTQAALGDSAEIPTLDGKIKLDIPSGIQSGKVLRVPGKGFPSIRSGARGNMLVEVVVMTPQKLSDAERELFGQLAEQNGQAVNPPKEGFFKKLFS